MSSNINLRNSIVISNVKKRLKRNLNSLCIGGVREDGSKVFKFEKKNRYESAKVGRICHKVHMLSHSKNLSVKNPFLPGKNCIQWHLNM